MPTGVWIAGIAVLGILGVSVAALAAVLLTRSDAETTTPAATPATASAPDDQAPAPNEPTEVDDVVDPEPTPTPSGRPTGSEIEPVIADYYNAVLAGDFDEAWSMLSPSYRSWKLGYNGKGAWLDSETDTYNRLEIDDVEVEVVSYDASTKIATISVSGMTYSTDDGPCSYEGITWVRKFDGEWRYDPGYVQRDGRAAIWRPRKFETLGYPCTGT